MPFLTLSGNSTVLQLWWRENGDIILLVGGSKRWQPSPSALEKYPEAGASLSELYMFSAGFKTDARFISTGITGIHRFVPSPDGSTIAVINKQGVAFHKSTNLQKTGTVIEYYNPRDLLWISQNQVLILGQYTIETVNLNNERYVLLGLSQAEQIGFDETGRVMAVNADRHYHWDSETLSWGRAIDKDSLRSSSLNTPTYRIYTRTLKSSSYANQIMIRTIDGFGNRELLTIPPKRTRLLPKNDDKLQSAYDPRVFDHGSRVSGGGRKWLWYSTPLITIQDWERY